MSVLPGSPAASARFFDGNSAEPHDATVWIEADTLRIMTPDGRVLADWRLGDVTRVAGPDPDGVVALGPAHGSARLRLADATVLRALPRPRHRLSAGWFAGGLLACGLAVGLALLPFPVALIPESINRKVGDIATPDFIAGRPTCHGAAGQAALEGLLTRLAQVGGLPGTVTLDVIQAPEVNAFALPGGHIVVLSGLLGTVRDGDELGGVLAHEMGHELHRDPLKRLLRSLFWTTVTQGVGAGSAAVGVQFATLAYDRAAEARADATALDLLAGAGLRADGLSRFLTLTEALHGDASPAWLTDHPATEERRRATATSDRGAAPLTEAEWQAVQAMCAP
jgi:Zn-dependent protease with chaperone function